MVETSYRLSEEYAALVNAELVSAARDFLFGKVGTIASVRKMSPLLQVIEEHRPDLTDAWMTVVGIDSETDALPVGELREIWHPSTAAIEDTKIKDAEERYGKRIGAVCAEIIHILGSKTN